MKKLLLAGVILLGLVSPSLAQPYQVVTTCGTQTLTGQLNNSALGYIDVTGKICTNASGGGGGAATIADGADVAEGALADAAATAGGTGSVSAKLRLMTTQLNAVATTANQATEISSLATIATNTGAAIPAGEAHIGEVGGNILPITNAMTTSNNTVTTGKSIGGLQTLANSVRVSGALGAGGTSGMIQSVILSFQDAIGTVPMDVYFFSASPTGSTCTDNTTFALVTADRDKTIAIVHVSDWTASNTAAIGQAANIAAPFGLASATSMFACVVTRGSAVVTGTTNASLITRILRN